MCRSTNRMGYIGNYGYVDLGLPSGLKWAICNVGAFLPSDYGSYYSWGEVMTKSSYETSNSLTHRKRKYDMRSAGIVDSLGTLAMTNDVVRSNWGGSWRMPTKEECQELKNKCTRIWTNHGGHNGYKVTGQNGHSIFIPAVGCRSGISLGSTGEHEGYWCSTSGERDLFSAYALHFSSGTPEVSLGDRSFGRTVRPVSE